MDYRTVKAGRLLAAILRGRGFDADSYTLTVKERAQYADLLNGFLRKAWESEFWPQLMLVERRQYRPDWDVAVSYAEGIEVYYAAGDAYYRAAQTNVGVTPGTDSAVWAAATDLLCFVAFSQDFGTGTEIDDTGVDYERCAYEDDPLVTPDAAAIRGCRPWQRTILMPAEGAVTRPYIRFRPPCPEISFTAWSGATAYTTGETAYLDADQNSYVALRPNSGANPATQNEDWAPVGVPTMFADYLRLAVTAEQQADDEGKYRTLAKAQEELDRLRDRHLPAAGLGGRAAFRYVRGLATALTLSLGGMALGDGARNPGDYSAPGTRTGTPPAYTAGSNTNPAAQRAITVYGGVNTNDFLVFMDRTGYKVRGTNLIDQVEGWALGAATQQVAAEVSARIAGDAAGSNYAVAVGNTVSNTLRTAISNETAGLYYPLANPSNYITAAAIPAQTNQPYVAQAGTSQFAVAAGTVTNAATLSVADARRLIQTDTNAWITVVNGTGVLWHAAAPATTDVLYVSGVAGTDYNGPPIMTQFFYQGSSIMYPGGTVYAWTNEDWLAEWYETGSYIRLSNDKEDNVWISTPTEKLPIDLLPDYDDYNAASGTVTIAISGQAYPLATDASTVIRISAHDANPWAHAATLASYVTTNAARYLAALTNAAAFDAAGTAASTNAAHVAAPDPHPVYLTKAGLATNVISGWRLYDPGSNVWWTVTVSNLRFTVWGE